jgi:hypothetical protein
MGKNRNEWSYYGTYGRQYTNLVAKDVNCASICSQISRKKGATETALIQKNITVKEQK